MNGTEVCTPVDLEGHLGKDKNYYIIDCSRLFPPTTPNIQRPCCYLYQLLRPEFLSLKTKVPLNSDSMSPFVRSDDNFETHNAEIETATSHLLESVIPALANELSKDAMHLPFGALKRFFHQEGIK